MDDGKVKDGPELMDDYHTRRREMSMWRWGTSRVTVQSFIDTSIPDSGVIVEMKWTHSHPLPIRRWELRRYKARITARGFFVRVFLLPEKHNMPDKVREFAG